jgi:prevent-host-death family protein
LTPKEKPSREVALAAVKDDLSRYLRLAETSEVVITRHGKPAGVLIGFASEDDWFEYRLENHPEFLRRVSEARRAFDGQRGVRIEELG